MANFHMEVKAISRGKGQSVTGLVNYISGRTLYDSYNGKTYYKHRSDILFCRIFLPDGSPSHFCDLQRLCNEIDGAERRYDARTAREFIGSLPNELPQHELSRIVEEYVEENFTVCGLCAVAAIHQGKNEADPSRDNPHTHILVSTRTVGPDGFNTRKNPEWDKRTYVKFWREQWAEVQNRAYERNGLPIRVSHESLEVQGNRSREPTIHLSRIDWQRELKGEHTPAGDRKREIEERNRARANGRQLTRERILETERSR